jgi:hypothetical protein
MSKTFTPKVIKKLVRNVLRMEQDKPVHFQVTGEVYKGKENPEKPNDKPADLCDVINMDTGEEMTVIVPAVLLSIWNEVYPEAAYVGKGFAVTKGEKPEGKRYFKYSVDEIEV